MKFDERSLVKFATALINRAHGELRKRRLTYVEFWEQDGGILSATVDSYKPDTVLRTVFEEYQTKLQADASVAAFNTQSLDLYAQHVALLLVLYFQHISRTAEGHEFKTAAELQHSTVRGLLILYPNDGS